MPHRDRHLPVAPLQALHARQRRAPEVLLQRRRDGIRLLRLEKPELALLFVLDELARLPPRTLADVHLRILQVRAGISPSDETAAD